MMSVSRADSLQLTDGLPEPELDNIPIRDTFVDQSLQRAMNTRNVKEISRTWNDHKAGAIIVSERDGETGPRYHVMDGGTRRNAKAQHLGDAAVRDGATIRALVYRDLSKQDEAKLFLVFNDERSNVPPSAKFYVALEAGIDPWVTLDKVLEKRSLAISNPPDPTTVDPNRSYVVSCPGTLVRICDTHGTDGASRALDYAFDAIDAAYPTFPDSVRYQGWLVEATALLYLWGERYDAVPDVDRLVAYLQKGVTTANIVSHTPDLLKNSVRTLAMASSGNMGHRARDLMIRIYNAHARGQGIPEPWNVPDVDEDEGDDEDLD